jgi:hypothetical protein
MPRARQPDGKRTSLAALVKQRAKEGQGPVIMTRTPRSSHVASVGYDKERRTLYVEYLEVKPRPGRPQPKRLRPGTTVVYKYFNVPPYIYTQLLHVPSVGKYLWRRVYGGKYRYVRLGRKGWRGRVGGHRAQRRRAPAQLKRRG